jgi:hypothetical protein
MSIILTYSSFAQTKMFINKTSGTDSLLLSDIQSITFKTYSTSSGIIYSQNFISAPNYSIYDGTPLAGDTFIWDSTAGVFKVHLTETTPFMPKFATSPSFAKVNNMSFILQIDVDPVSISYGMGIGVRLFDADSGISKPSFEFLQAGSDNPRFIFYDANDAISYNSGAPILGTWYTITITYTNSTGTANIQVVNRATSAVFYQQSGVAFIPNSFNSIGLGAETGAGDGTTADMYYDNISLTITP